MPDTDSIVIAKSFNYRGSPEVWTNKYHLEGTTPADLAAARTLLRAIWDSEKVVLGSDVTLVGGSFYNAGNEAAAFMFDATNIGGTSATNAGSSSTSATTPGDTSVWVRWGTAERNSKNKPIYLRKYFHGIPLQASDGDIVPSATRTALLAHGAKMYDGSLPGGMKICGPQGADAISHGVAQFTTTRTLKRNARTPT